jgi:hypothetical protein
MRHYVVGNASFDVSQYDRCSWSDPRSRNKNGGQQEFRLLEVCVFEDAAKHSVYEKQTSAADAKSKSNCQFCAMGHDAGPTTGPVVVITATGALTSNKNFRLRNK